MRLNFSFLLILLLGLGVSTSQAQIVPPIGLQPGDQYRLIVAGMPVTHYQYSDPYSSYRFRQANEKAQIIADDALVGELGATWQVVITYNHWSDPIKMSAKDHTGTNPAKHGVGVPIYQSNGTRVAADYADLWDGTLETPIRYGFNGEYKNDSNMYIDNSGTYEPTGKTASWFTGSGGWWHPTAGAPCYAMSSILTVPGEPPTNTAPTVTCPEATEFECGPASQNVTLTVDLSDDDNDALTVEWRVDGELQQSREVTGATDSFIFTYGMGVSEVTVTVDDGIADPVGCATVITVVDTTEPVAICGDDVEVTNDPGECFASNVSLESPMVSDNCEVVSVTNNVPASGIFPVGVTEVTWTVTDAGGNEGTCVQLVTVLDSENPTITSPDDIVVSHESGVDYATVELREPPTFDNCEVVSVTNDAPGDNKFYVVFPIVVTWTATDASGNKAYAQQLVTVTNQEPVADAGANQLVVGTAAAGASVGLNGSASSDPDEGDILSYLWSATGITFDDETSATPTATFPLGTTTVTLTVADQCGATSQAVVTIEVNEAPTAVPGDDQSIRAGSTVYLDGSDSFDDNTSSLLLDYAWSFSSKPAGSTASLDYANTVLPEFEADIAGTYVVQLIVTDGQGASSDPAQVVISSDNLAPTAVATVDFPLAVVGNSIQFDGSESTDPEGDMLTYAWFISVQPSGSTATLSGVDTATPTLTTDVEGSYELILIVSDFLGAGEPAFVEVTATTATEFAEIVILDSSDQIAALNAGQVTTQGNQNALGNHLSNTIKNIQKGKVDKAIDSLNKAIERTDGCALRGAPDGNGSGRDWITDCEAQVQLYDLLNAALEALNNS